MSLTQLLEQAAENVDHAHLPDHKLSQRIISALNSLELNHPDVAEEEIQ